MFTEKSYNHLKNKVLETALLETDMNSKFGNKDVNFEEYFRETALEKALKREIELSTNENAIKKIIAKDKLFADEADKPTDNIDKVNKFQQKIYNNLKNDFKNEIPQIMNSLRNKDGNIDIKKVEELEDTLKKENRIFTMIKDNKDMVEMTTFKDMQKDMLAYTIKEYVNENRKVLDVEVPAVSIKNEIKEKYDKIFDKVYPNKVELIESKSKEFGLTLENGKIKEFENYNYENNIKDFLKIKNNEILEQISEVIEIIKEDKNSRDISTKEFEATIKEDGRITETGITDNLNYIANIIYSDWRTEKIESIIENKKFEEFNVENPSVQKELKEKMNYFDLSKFSEKEELIKLEENYNTKNKIEDMKQYEYNLKLKYNETIKENNKSENEIKQEKEKEKYF